MPIYEYFCPACNVRFELLRRRDQVNQPASCPRCQADAHRLFSSFACFSKGSEGTPTRIGGGSSCSACSATSCDSCKI